MPSSQHVYCSAPELTSQVSSLEILFKPHIFCRMLWSLSSTAFTFFMFIFTAPTSPSVLIWQTSCVECQPATCTVRHLLWHNLIQDGVTHVAPPQSSNACPARDTRSNIWLQRTRAQEGTTFLLFLLQWSPVSNYILFCRRIGLMRIQLWMSGCTDKQRALCCPPTHIEDSLFRLSCCLCHTLLGFFCCCYDSLLCLGKPFHEHIHGWRLSSHSSRGKKKRTVHTFRDRKSVV